MDGKKIVEEIKEEESFLLKLFQLEGLVNKYKFQIMGFFALIVVIAIGYGINSYINEQSLIKTNKAYNKLLVNPNDKKSLIELKNNPKLFHLYLIHNYKNIDELKKVANANGVIGNIAKYELASLKGDKNSLEDYSMSLDAIYKDLALLNVERLYLKDNNHKKAEETAMQIKDTQIQKLAQSLLHYGIVQ